eukprot:20276-Amphidinium_carterae.1
METIVKMTVTSRIRYAESSDNSFTVQVALATEAAVTSSDSPSPVADVQALSSTVVHWIRERLPFDWHLET